MNPIIFLDIDEVICITFTRGTAYRDTDQYGEYFDDGCVKQLRRIVEASGAEIVLSSSWREDGWEKNTAMWSARRMPGNLIGVTPLKGETFGWGGWGNVRTTRGEEIYLWMEKNGVPERYVILDDRDDMLPFQMPHLVQTVAGEGLTEELADKAIAILVGDHNNVK